MEVQYEDPADSRPKPLLGFKKTSLTPPILLACRESFQVAREHYTPAFSTLGCIAETYFNFDLDILFIDSESFFRRTRSFTVGLGQVPSKDLRKVKNLAVTPPAPLYEMDWEEWVNDVLGTFGNVRHLSVVAKPFDPLLSPAIDQPGTVLVFKRFAEIKPATYLESDGSTRFFEDVVYDFGVFSYSSLEIARRRWDKRIERRRQRGRDKGQSCWKIPEIDYMVVLTSAKSSELEQSLEGISDGSEDDSYTPDLQQEVYGLTDCDSDDTDSTTRESDSDEDDDDGNNAESSGLDSDPDSEI